MIFITFFLILALISTVISIQKNEIKFFYYVLLIPVYIFSLFRYGQGIDYFSYAYHFERAPYNLYQSLIVETNIDKGFNLLMSISKNLGIDYLWFNIIIATLTLYLFTVTIEKNSKFKHLSLLMFYSIYYFIYINSGIRQGLAMGLVFYGFFKYLKNNKTNKFIFTTLLASTFHISALISILFLLIKKLSISYFNVKIVNITLILTSIVLLLTNFSSLISNVITSFSSKSSFVVESPNYITIGLRILFLILVYLLIKQISSDKLTDFEKIMIYIYFIGTLLYISVSRIYIFSRIFEYFFILEIIFLPNLLKKLNIKKNRYIYTQIIIALSLILLVKDINSFTISEKYYQKGVINYQFINIFDKDKIYEVQNISNRIIN